MIVYMVAALAVVLVGIAKGGLGGGISIMAVPLFILVLEPREALGIMLPLLSTCDLFALYHYRQNFDRTNILRLLPGSVLGIGLGSLFLGTIGEETLEFWIGILSMAFVAYQVGKNWILRELADYRPPPWHAWIFGTAVGVTSTLAHAAGPVATMFLLPQNLGRRLFVGTTVVLFTIVNLIKLIPYVYLDMITVDRLGFSASLLPFVPLGVLLGIWLNRRLQEQRFTQLIYSLLFLIGLKLTTGLDPVAWLAGLLG